MGRVKEQWIQDQQDIWDALHCGQITRAEAKTRLIHLCCLDEYEADDLLDMAEAER
jgi:hypothetical protein